MPLKPDSVESGYVSPLCSLWEDQRTGGVSTYDHPRGPLVRAFMDDLKRARTELRRAAYEDRAIKNLKDGYNFDESRKFSEVLLNGLNGSEEWEKIFRTRIDLLSMHAMILRSETMRYAELPDLCSLCLDNEGPHCLAVIQQITRGKTVRREDGGDNRKTNYHGYLRHRDVLACPVGALAQWFMYRWDLAGETPPDFRDRASWYGKKLTPASLTKPEVEISHSTQGAWVNRVFALVGIFVSALLHAPRKAVARWVDLQELPWDQVYVPFPFEALSTDTSADPSRRRVGQVINGNIIPCPLASIVHEVDDGFLSRESGAISLETSHCRATAVITAPHLAVAG